MKKIVAKILDDYVECYICKVRTKKVVNIGVYFCGLCVIEMFQNYLLLDNMDIREFLDKSATLGMKYRETYIELEKEKLK